MYYEDMKFLEPYAADIVASRRIKDDSKMSPTERAAMRLGAIKKVYDTANNNHSSTDNNNSLSNNNNNSSNTIPNSSNSNNNISANYCLTSDGISQLSVNAQPSRQPTCSNDDSDNSSINSQPNSFLDFNDDSSDLESEFGFDLEATLRTENQSAASAVSPRVVAPGQVSGLVPKREQDMESEGKLNGVLHHN